MFANLHTVLVASRNDFFWNFGISLWHILYKSSANNILIGYFMVLKKKWL